MVESDGTYSGYEDLGPLKDWGSFLQRNSACANYITRHVTGDRNVNNQLLLDAYSFIKGSVHVLRTAIENEKVTASTKPSLNDVSSVVIAGYGITEFLFRTLSGKYGLEPYLSSTLETEGLPQGREMRHDNDATDLQTEVVIPRMKLLLMSIAELLSNTAKPLREDEAIALKELANLLALMESEKVRPNIHSEISTELKSDEFLQKIAEIESVLFMCTERYCARYIDEVNQILESKNELNDRIVKIFEKARVAGGDLKTFGLENTTELSAILSSLKEIQRDLEKMRNLAAAVSELNSVDPDMPKVIREVKFELATTVTLQNRLADSVGVANDLVSTKTRS